MDKTWHSHDYEVLIELLKQRRHKACLTQVELAERIGQTQSFVSKIERLALRLDVIQVRIVCHAIGCSFVGMMRELDERLSKEE